MSGPQHEFRSWLERIDREDRLHPSTRPLPDWMPGWLQQVADLFEPFSGIARAGYECVHTQNHWEISMFLGQNEVVGGRHDGLLLPINFRFDAAALPKLFDTLQVLAWNAFPNGYVFQEAGYSTESFLLAEGRVWGEEVKLRIQATPPDSVEPGLQLLPNGQYSLT